MKGESSENMYENDFTSKTVLADSPEKGGKDENDDTKSIDSDSEPSEKYLKNLKKIVWKNVFLMSLVFMLNYISYGGLSGLQSSLHIQEGMGVICTSIRYISLVISTLFVPELMIRGVGHKWTITLSLIGFILWMAANGYGVWATMVPASIINGIFVAPLWAAQGSYFTEWAKEYAKHTNQRLDGIQALFFGIFYMFYLGAAVFGNIISTTVLKASPPDNYTALTDEEVEAQCGLNDCPWNEFNNTNLEKPPDNVVWTLVGIYIVIALVAIFLSIFAVDNLPKHVTKKGEKKPFKEELSKLMVSTVKLMGRVELWLLVPITFYTGTEETFFFAEFNRSWITCALGIWMIGIVNVPFGLSSAIVAYFSGNLTKLFGRMPVLIAAMIMDISTQITLYLWVPVSSENSDEWVYYIISLVWGTYDGIWLTITSALYGIIFPNDTEAAYSNYMLFQCLGYASAFGYSYFLCTNVKMYILSGSFVVGIVCYFILEFHQRRSGKQVVVLAEKEVDYGMDHGSIRTLDTVM